MNSRRFPPFGVEADRLGRARETVCAQGTQGASTSSSTAAVCLVRGAIAAEPECDLWPLDGDCGFPRREHCCRDGFRGRRPARLAVSRGRSQRRRVSGRQLHERDDVPGVVGQRRDRRHVERGQDQRCRRDRLREPRARSHRSATCTPGADRSRRNAGGVARRQLRLGRDHRPRTKPPRGDPACVGRRRVLVRTDPPPPRLRHRQVVHLAHTRRGVRPDGVAEHRESRLRAGRRSIRPPIRRSPKYWPCAAIAAHASRSTSPTSTRPT